MQPDITFQSSLDVLRTYIVNQVSSNACINLLQMSMVLRTLAALSQPFIVNKQLTLALSLTDTSNGNCEDAIRHNIGRISTVACCTCYFTLSNGKPSLWRNTYNSRNITLELSVAMGSFQVTLAAELPLICNDADVTWTCVCSK